MNQSHKLPHDFEKQFFSRSLLFAKYVMRIPKDRDALRIFKNAKVSITASKELLKVPNGQHMALMSANLLSRFCSNISLCIPPDIETAIDFPMATEYYLWSSLEKLCKAVNPSINIGPKPRSDEKCDASIIIGSGKVGTGAKISVNSHGWIAYINTEGGDFSWVSPNQNPIGAQLAACIGVAELFKALFSNESINIPPSGSFIFSAFDYGFKENAMLNPPLPSSIPIETVHLISAGAINSATAYALRSIPGMSGKLIIIDPQTLEVSNLNRYLLATADDVILNRLKVDVLKQFISGPFKAVTFPGDYRQYRTCAQTLPLDLTVVGVDRDESRWDVQKDFPRVVLCGGTELSLVQTSRHDDFLNKACVGCLWPKLSMDNRTLINEEQPAPAISFVSALAGVLLAAEIIKERVDAFRKTRLDITLYLNALKPSFLQIRRPSKSDQCGCNCRDSRIINIYRHASRLS